MLAAVGQQPPRVPTGSYSSCCEWKPWQCFWGQGMGEPMQHEGLCGPDAALHCWTGSLLVALEGNLHLLHSDSTPGDMQYLVATRLDVLQLEYVQPQGCCAVGVFPHVVRICVAGECCGGASLLQLAAAS